MKLTELHLGRVARLLLTKLAAGVVPRRSASNRRPQSQSIAEPVMK